MLCLTLLIVMLAQDTTAVVHDQPGVLGFITGYVLSTLVPLLTSWLTKNYLNLRDTWYSRIQSSLVKGLIYVVGTAAISVALSYLGLGVPDNLDATNLSGDIISRIINALVVTIAVHFGIKTERTRAVTGLRGPNG